MTDSHVTVNRDFWNGMAAEWVALGERQWALDTPTWGLWNLPDDHVTLLPADMTGLDAIELGCGNGYVAGWMARRGARVTAIDVSDRQLETARRLAAEHGADITFLEGNAEATGLAGASFDFAVSEYGAAIWCDPRVWLPEAHRLLRPGGRLAFLGNHPLMFVATPLSGDVTDFTFHRPYRDTNRFDWTDAEVEPGGIEFNLTVSAWMALFREVGFEVLDYRELFAPETATGVRGAVTADWAKRYPSEQVWWLKKPA